MTSSTLSRSRGRGRRSAPLPALAFARAQSGPGARGLLALQIARSVGAAATALALAWLAGNLIERGTLDGLGVGAALTALGATAMMGFLAETHGARLEATVAGAILDAASARLGSAPAREVAALPRGALISGLQRHPGALARLVVGHAMARQMMGIGPLIAAAAVIPVSWEAALVLLAATPVMIVFFALVGGLIRDRAADQEAALGRLASQFADRIRTLPTILAQHGLTREGAKLDERLAAYARGTMGVLSVAFLNAGVLDFFSSLAIAILAVFLGLGHLGLIDLPGFSHLPLWQSLLILLLAPEYFAPFRRYAELYHAKAEGETAAAALDWAFSTSEPVASERPEQPAAVQGGRGLVLAHVGPVPDFDFPRTGLVVLTGRSGAGKSTLLRALAGVEPPLAGRLTFPADDGRRSWASVDALVPEGTLEQAIAAGTGASPAVIAAMADQLGLSDDPHWPGGLTARIEAGAENLSGGQRMRVAVARLLLRTGTAFCDEPTAKLDPVNAERVRCALLAAAQTRLVLVATHDPALIARAQVRIGLDRDHSHQIREAA